MPSSHSHGLTAAVRRKDSKAVDSESNNTTRSTQALLDAHPAIKPLTIIPAATAASSLKTTAGTRVSPKPTAPPAGPSVGSQIVQFLLKPLYFLLFAIFHIGHELMLSFKTMKTMTQVFFLPHKFPIAPELVRILREDLGREAIKKPRHLATILPASDMVEPSESDEENWQTNVARLAQWSVASGIQCLSIMRTEPLHPGLLESLQKRVNHSLAEFYREEKEVPVALIRTLSPVEESLRLVNERRTCLGTDTTQKQQEHRFHGGRTFDLDIVILSEQDGHDRLAGNVRALGEAALRKEIESDDITTSFLDEQFSGELSEPELLIVFKDDLDLSSYPPWHIRLSEIYHHPDQSVIPHYTMFLQALHRYAKCEQRFGK
ncbi:hypothetical protein BG011_001864 [Mortierella polycephala]|uniref:ditrans,polycis-polyprenyl diphosphate synthase [(2E,6E)-farnesyldiphosphate specific] n=1 Tax=Mortierella polycephala TaxID=41804 RepID=A0A9P6U5F0_9FUNG|nr:hypothetical protein BG011_001864 [Mortierella polycephala]